MASATRRTGDGDGVRDRIKSLRRVRAGDLQADPRNWRMHPDDQRKALASAMARNGWIVPIIARETPDGLVIVDGHLRADMDPDARVPVVVVDLDEREGGEALATVDPLARMAQMDTGALESLLDELAGDGSWQELMRDIDVLPQAQAVFAEGVEEEPRYWVTLSAPHKHADALEAAVDRFLEEHADIGVGRDV